MTSADFCMFNATLTTSTLAFGYVLPTTWQTPDLHRLESCAAGRTKQIRRQSGTGAYRFYLSTIILDKRKCIRRLCHP